MQPCLLRFFRYLLFRKGPPTDIDYCGLRLPGKRSTFCKLERKTANLNSSSSYQASLDSGEQIDMGMPFLYHDLRMLIFLAPALILAAIAQLWVRSAYARGQAIAASMSGFLAA